VSFFAVLSLGRKYHKNSLREHEYPFTDSPEKIKIFLKKNELFLCYSKKYHYL
jgi:hypothetical protein